MQLWRTFKESLDGLRDIVVVVLKHENYLVVTATRDNLPHRLYL